MRRKDASNTSVQSLHALLREALPTMRAHMLNRSPRVRTRSFSAQLQHLPSHSDPDGLCHVVLTRPEVRPDAVSVRELTDLPWASFRHSVTRLPLPSASTFKADIFDILLPDFVQGTSTPLDRAHAGHTQVNPRRQCTRCRYCRSAALHFTAISPPHTLRVIEAVRFKGACSEL